MQICIPFLTQILEKLADRVEVRGQKARQMLLPHCTWDKFGEILSESGARSLGLFDELSFFATMNMYSSHKMQLSDTREFQDFLQLFTGKSKTRETGAIINCINIRTISSLRRGTKNWHKVFMIDTINNIPLEF